MKRQEALKVVLDNISEDTKVITSCGFISRDANALASGIFPLTGSMGTTAAFSIGWAFSTESRIMAIMGDGDYMMGFNSILNLKKSFLYLQNLTHVVLADGKYQSTGGQRNVWDTNTIFKMAGACYNSVYVCTVQQSLGIAIKNYRPLELIIVEIDPADREVSVRISDDILGDLFE